MFVRRDLEAIFKRFTKFPAVAILGPRQSGKTTLARKYFAKHTYLNFEHPDNRNFAKRDPEGFFKNI